MTFDEWARQYDSHKVLAAELEVARLGDGATTTLFWATDGGQWDDQHNFIPCLQGLSRLSHRAQQLVSGRSVVSFGELKAAIDRASYVDSNRSISWDALLAEYALAGRRVILRVGGPGLDWNDWARFDLYMGQPAHDDLAVSVPVYGQAEKAAQKMVPPNTYDDSYPEAVRGRAKPLCWGRCKNIAPLLIGENPWVYQFNDGSVQAVDAVYIDGVQQSSGYTVDLSAGTVSFASDPQGTVTLDVRGRLASGSYIELPGDIARDILVSFGGVAEADLDTAAFSQFNADVPFPVGLYLDRQVEVRRALDALLVGLLSVWGTTREGKWTLWRFKPPSGEPVLELSDIELLNAKVRPEERIFWRAVVAGDRNWSPQSSPDAAVSPQRRQWLRDQFRQREATDSSVAALFPLAGEAGPHESCLADLQDCATVAGWWLELFGQRRRILEVSAKLQPLALRLGDVVRVRRERFGMQDGWLGRVVGIEENLVANEIKLKLWG